MTTAPAWMVAVIRDFGRAAGLNDLVLNGRGAVAFRFETGRSLRLEYTGSELVMAITLPSADLKRLRAAAHPMARHGVRARAGILRKTGEAVVAVRIAERDVTLPRLDASFGALWRIAGEVGGSAWA